MSGKVWYDERKSPLRRNETAGMGSKEGKPMKTVYIRSLLCGQNGSIRGS